MTKNARKAAKHGVSGHKKKQIAGIEPVSPAWEASVLPMNYICMSVSITQTPQFEKRKIKMFFRYFLHGMHDGIRLHSLSVGRPSGIYRMVRRTCRTPSLRLVSATKRVRLLISFLALPMA